MKKLFILTASLLLASCATPHVVQEKQVADKNLNCEELTEQISAAEKFEEEAREEKGLTGTNVAAAVFFLPGMFATYVNADEAIDAAQDRIEHLTKLYQKKNC